VKGLVSVVLKLFDGAGWRRQDRQDFESKSNKGKDVARRIVASIGVAVFTENDAWILERGATGL
jgi:hypothetical protein